MPISAPKTLRDGRVLRIDRDNLTWHSRRLHEWSTDDERLLVGERQHRSRTNGRQSRHQTDGSRNSIKDDVRTNICQVRGGLRPDHQVATEVETGEGSACRRISDGNDWHIEFPGLFGQKCDVSATRRKSDHSEAITITSDDLKRLRTDGSRGSEDDDAAGHAAIVPCRSIARVTPNMPFVARALPRLGSRRMPS